MSSQREALDDLLSHLVFLSTDGMGDPKHWIEYRKGGKTIPAGTAIAALISQQAKERTVKNLQSVLNDFHGLENKKSLVAIVNEHILAELERSSDE